MAPPQGNCNCQRSPISSPCITDPFAHPRLTLTLDAQPHLGYLGLSQTAPTSTGDRMTSPPIMDTVANTRTGRYIQNIELPPEITALLFPTDDTPPRCIASKSQPDQYHVIDLGIYPLPGTGIEIEHVRVHANLQIHTTVMP